MGNAPHVHTCDEAKKNINAIEHNADNGYGPPSGSGGGSAKVRNSGDVANVTNNQKGDDYVGKRSI